MSGRGRASGGRGRTGTQPESVEKAEVTVNAAATSDKKFSGTADARYQTKRSNSQSSREAKPKVSAPYGTVHCMLFVYGTALAGHGHAHVE